MNKPISKKFNEINLGMSAEFTVAITSKMVEDFSILSGDFNPLHTNEVYAQANGFNNKIPHGMIAGCLFSRLIGMHLPGEHALYLSQSLFFHQPLLLDQEILVSGKVIQIIEAMQAIKLKTEIFSLPEKTLLVSGEALVKVLK